MQALQKLRRDRRGLILIVAIPMGAMLVGLLWYLATVGDGVLFRERLQDAADATAFENAVLHARGMNALAMINMLMSLLLSVVVALRIAEIILAAGLVFFGVTAEPLADVLEIDEELAPKIGQAVGMMNKLEKGIAAATPVMASVLSSGGNSTFYQQHGAANLTLGLSYALFPAELDARFSVDPANRSLLKYGGGGGAARMGSTLLGGAGRVAPSLPAQDGSYDVLCARAVTVGFENLIALASRLNAPHGLVAPLEKFSGIFRHLLVKSKIDAVFCKSVDDAVEGAADELIDSACDDSKLPDKPPTKGDKTTAAPGSPDPTRTKADAQAAVSQCQQLSAKTGEGAGDQAEQLPAEMWERAQNGNVILQTWAMATSKGPKNQDADERGMAIASPQNRPHLTVDKFASAQAEYYFACSSDSAGQSPTWSACKEDALWALGWTARLRRFWWPLAQLQTAGDTVLRFEQAFSAIEGFLERGLRDVYKGTSSGQLGEDADAALRARDVYRSLSGPKDGWVH